MTPIEREALDVFREIVDHFAPGRPVGQAEFRDVMGHVRDMVKKLENMEYGCPTGRHSSYCTCLPAIEGKCRRPEQPRRG